MQPKRVTLFVGHYGSGKTNIAVNYAFHLKKSGRSVVIGDMDIVNPYFRTEDSRGEIEAAGIRLICSPYANSNVDLPSLPQELYGAVEDKRSYAVLDVGGDDRGALALGRYVPYLLTENNYEMALVVNFYRPLTRNWKEAEEVLREIESACGVHCTGLINNSNLGVETTPQSILITKNEMETLSARTGLPIWMTTVESKWEEPLEGLIPDLFPLRLQKKL